MMRRNGLPVALHQSGFDEQRSASTPVKCAAPSSPAGRNRRLPGRACWRLLNNYYWYCRHGCSVLKTGAVSFACCRTIGGRTCGQKSSVTTLRIGWTNSRCCTSCRIRSLTIPAVTTSRCKHIDSNGTQNQNGGQCDARFHLRNSFGNYVGNIPALKAL